jgi:hypothetical protein
MSTIEQEIKSQIENAAHPVMVPGARELSDLFERVEVVTDLSRYTSGRAKTWRPDELGRGGSVRRGAGEAWLSTFCGVRGTPFSLDVWPTAEVLELVERRMMICDGTVINFEITIRNGGRCALVAAHYNQISGSRWFAIVDADKVRALCPPSEG